MRIGGFGVVGALLLPLLGCGSGRDANLPSLVPLSGTVTWGGRPLTGAVITFTPVGATRGTGSTGRTSPEGKYTLKARGGGAGAVAGQYKVVISKLVLPDGSDFPADSPVGPMDSPAREVLPSRYSDPERTKLTARVPEGGGTVDFPLEAGKN